MDRMKTKQAITYPLSINMRPYVGEYEADLWYDLRGVLLHRGPSAYHGHYEAQVFDVAYGFTPWASLQPRNANEYALFPSQNKWFLFNDEQVNEIQPGELLGKQVNGTSRFGVSPSSQLFALNARIHRSQGSKDAYMLIYAQRGVPPVDAVALRLPDHTLRAVNDINATHTALCDAYTQK
jgi:hypothetical protein